MKGVCYFFLKTSDKSITTANVANEVNFGVIEATEGLLGGIEQLLSKVMVPALKAQDNWGQLSTNGNKNKQVSLKKIII